MQLRFCQSEIPYWAKRYPSPVSKLENELTDKTLVNKVQQQEYLDINLLRKVAKWKSQRRVALIDENSESDVKEITRYAFTTPSERVRHGILRCLDGVELPTASAVLHFFHKDPYPIIDYRALWSIRVEKYNYSFSFWQEYVEFSRELAKSNNADMRTLDRALWQYSREKQEKG